MNKVKKPSRLMIVAHPDDESLFGGQALLSNKDWTVICVTNASNEVRREEFKQAMAIVGANYIMLDHQDNLSNGNFHPCLREYLQAHINNHSYQWIVTHNKKGEYGHPQHRALYHIVRSLQGNHQLFVFKFKRGKPSISEEKQQLLAVYRSQAKSVSLFQKLAGKESLQQIR